MRYRVRHLTRYGYSKPVDLGAHVMHLLPRAMLGQNVLSASLRASPEPTRRTEGRDHFGNRLTWMFLDRAHPTFQVLSDMLVDVEFPAPPAPLETPVWEAVAAMAREGGGLAADASEFIFASPMVPATPEAGAYAQASFPPGAPVLQGLVDLTYRIRREFSFRAGVTTLATPITSVLARREGVCQDFSHLMIAALRALGLPARYVSGYIRTRPPPGAKRRIGADQSHAWVGGWLGPQHGWVGFDPTNGLVVRDEHIVLAWGRDYSDISPLKGIILGGGGKHGLSVSVDTEPLD